MKREIRIVFMGTPNFAVPSLDALINESYNVAGVVTSPDKPAGRGQKVTISAVKAYSILKGLNILQPENLKSPVFYKQLCSLNANLFVVVAFRMLPEIIWSIPEYGTFNLHASLLPQYRGAAPINHVIINGEKQTGVTTFFINNNKIDTGNIIFQEKTLIGDNETAGELHDRLMNIGSHLVLNTVKAIETNKYKEIQQKELINDNDLKTAPKIYKSDCSINWKLEVDQIHNFIRGLSPYPGAFGELFINDENITQVKLLKTRYTKVKHNNNFGSIKTDQRNEFSVWVKDGLIIIDELQIPGKKRLKTGEFLNGFKLDNCYFL
jgi:methionyl-tRNA formyltransferase